MGIDHCRADVPVSQPHHVAVAKVSRQGLFAHRDGVEVGWIAGRDVAYLNLVGRQGRRR